MNGNVLIAVFLYLRVFRLSASDVCSARRAWAEFGRDVSQAAAAARLERRRSRGVPTDLFEGGL